MKLYHGSNMPVENPAIIDGGLKGLDFGRGFYTTSNYEQAVRFTENVVRRNKTGQKTVSVYEIDTRELFTNCTFLKFEEPEELWLDFVVLNRTLKYKGTLYDLIVGPVADDTVYTVINLYINGLYDKEETIKRLKVRELFNQWTFCSEQSLAFLKFVNAKTII